MEVARRETSCARGFGISVGGGSYLRDVSVTDNLIHRCLHRSLRRHRPDHRQSDQRAKDGAIRAMNGPTPTGPYLARASAEAFPNLAIYSNVAR